MSLEFWLDLEAFLCNFQRIASHRNRWDDERARLVGLHGQGNARLQADQLDGAGADGRSGRVGYPAL
jgi:hypothetical protein